MNKSTVIEKEKLRLLFLEDRIVYAENPKESTKKETLIEITVNLPTLQDTKSKHQLYSSLLY